MNGYSHQFPGVQQSSGFSNGLQSGGIGMFPPTSVVGISPSAMMIPPGAAAFSMQQSFYQAGVLPVQQFMAPGYQAVQSVNGTMRPTLNHQPPVSHSKQTQNSADEAKHRHFIEQQKRLQQFGSRPQGGDKKLDADTLIASIISKAVPQPVHTSQKSTVPFATVPSTTSSQAAPSSDVDDSFGDFLSGVPSTMTATRDGFSLNQPLSVPCEAPSSVTVTAATAHSIIPDPGKHEKKDLQSMMMECFDLSAPKQAQIINNKKPAVRDVSVTKASTVKYNESCSARHWSNDPSENLSNLFTLPAPPPATMHVPAAVAHPAQVAERPVVKRAQSDNPWGFPLPRWVTGELPVPELYVSVLRAVTSSEGCIETDLVYPVLLRSNLPNEVLGYIWELCNKTTPGRLIQEELFLILAMISVAQNNMDYTSLGILTRCLQAPIPNLEQVPQSIAPVVQPANPPDSHFHEEVPHQRMLGFEGPLSPLGFPGDSQGFNYGVVPVDMVLPAGLQSQLHVGEHNVIGTSSKAVYETAAFTSSGLDVRRNVSIGTAPPAVFESAAFASSGLHSQNQSVPDDDDFADFQAASIVVNPIQVQNSSFSLPSQIHSNTAEVDLFKATEDKYDAFRMLSLETEKSHSLGSEIPQNDNILSWENQKTEFADFSSFHEMPVVNPLKTDINNKPHETFPSSASLSDIATTHSNKYAGDSSLFKSTSFIEEPHKAHEFDDLSVFKSISLNTELSKVRDFDDDWQEFQFIPATDSSSRKDVKISAPSGASQNLFETDNPSLLSSTKFELYDNDQWQKPVEANGGKSFQFNSGFEVQNAVTPNAFTTNSSPGHSNVTKTSFDNEKDCMKTSIKLPKAATKSTLFSVKALDFLPPDFPPENDNKDEDDFFNNRTNLKGGNGLSSLANIDLEEDSYDMVTKVRWKSSESSQDKNKLSSSDWDSWTKSSVKSSHRDIADDHSTVVPVVPLDESDSPSRDSQSVSSFDWSVSMPTTITANAGLADTEVKSVRSLELNSCMEEIPVPQNVPSVSPCQDVEPTEFIGWHVNETMKAQPPVAVKDLLNQGSLGVFGDRYSHLIGELQANDRHAYEWERCLEHCRNLLTQVEDSFSSVSSSAVCHELEVVEDGINFLTDLSEVYLVARRIIVEMKAASISNARLGLLVKDIDTTWSNLSAVFSRSPFMASCLSFDPSPALIMTSDDPELRSNACGLCLLNVQWDSQSTKISFGGRYYHAACANFWINFVDLTLPSLTVPELL